MMSETREWKSGDRCIAFAMCGCKEKTIRPSLVEQLQQAFSEWLGCEVDERSLYRVCADVLEAVQQPRAVPPAPAPPVPADVRDRVVEVLRTTCASLPGADESFWESWPLTLADALASANLLAGADALEPLEAEIERLTTLVEGMQLDNRCDPKVVECIEENLAALNLADIARAERDSALEELARVRPTLEETVAMKALIALAGNASSVRAYLDRTAKPQEANDNAE